jgi:hypothetical protein
MINITDNSRKNIAALDAIARAVLSTDTPGVSVSSTSTIHLLDSASASKQNQAQKIFDNWANLSPSPSVSSMVVGDADPTITQTSTDDDLAYVVTLDGALYSSGTVSVVAGTATLTLVDPEAGEYVIYFARTSGNFANGSTTITVTES